MKRPDERELSMASTDTQIYLHIAGLRCAACVQLIEFRMSQLPAIKYFRIHPVTQKANVVWQQEHLSLKQIIQAVVDLGYAAFPNQLSLDAYQARQKKWALWRLFVAGFAMMQVMMYAFPAYLVPVPEVDGDLTPDVDRLLKLASLVITVPVLLFSAFPFFQNAWRDVKHAHVGMDVPVSVGIIVTFMASCWGTVTGAAVYFDSVIMFVFLLLGARTIQDQVQARTQAALKVLSEIRTVQAHRLNDYPNSRAATPIEADAIMCGDVLSVAAGQQVPCDGLVLEGNSACDEALMTGESSPVPKTVSSPVIAGAINLHAELIVQAQQVGSSTQLAQMIAMMERASLVKPKLVELADQHASRFLFIILLIALVSGVAWIGIDSSRALWIAVSVIVVTCPCALSLATPGVMSAAIGQLAKQGVLVRHGRAIESLAKVTHIVLDKTGTLTYGQLKVLTCEFQAAPEQYQKIRALALSLASSSMHPVSKAIVEWVLREQPASQVVQLEAQQEFAGLGVQAWFEGHRYRLGRAEFVCEQNADFPDSIREKTLAIFGDESTVLAYFVLEDVVREDAPLAMAELRERGYRLSVISGDREAVVRAQCQICGIKDFHAEMRPAQKYDFVMQLQGRGAHVLMVGDGMNDGPALSLAQVSVAMGQGAPISQTRSDALLSSNRLRDLSYALMLASQSYKLIRQNLAWAILYNVLAIPAAVLGYIEPWHAALGMSLSSLIVVFNGLRVLRVRPQ